MNVRDPFNLRRTTAETPAFNVVRATAAQAAVGIREKAVEVGANALERGRQAVEDMSFTVPKNVPSFGNPQRLAEDQLWASSGVTARSAGHNHPAAASASTRPIAPAATRAHGSTRASTVAAMRLGTVSL